MTTIPDHPLAAHFPLLDGDEFTALADDTQLALDVLGDIDPASHAVAQETVKAAQFFTQEADGLQQEWSGRVWLNPPYSRPDMGRFVDKLVTEFRSGNVREAILLTHNYTDTEWFHQAIGAAHRVCFTRKRINFTSLAGEGAAPVQGQAFHYFGENVEKVEDGFLDHRRGRRTEVWRCAMTAIPPLLLLAEGRKPRLRKAPRGRFPGHGGKIYGAKSTEREPSASITHSIDGLVIASNGFLNRSKIYEEIAAGCLKARKFGTRTGILDNDFRDWLATLPEMNPTKTGGAK